MRGYAEMRRIGGAQCHPRPLPGSSSTASCAAGLRCSEALSLWIARTSRSPVTLPPTVRKDLHPMSKNIGGVAWRDVTPGAGPRSSG
jgi:hypothetical protein